MRIGELSRQSGASPRSLRHYEKMGLLPAQRGSGNYREFDENAVEKVQIIQTLLGAGLTTRTIARLLPCMRLIGGKAVPCSDLQSELIEERRRLLSQQATIRHSIEVLDEVITSAQR